MSVEKISTRRFEEELDKLSSSSIGFNQLKDHLLVWIQYQAEDLNSNWDDYVNFDSKRKVALTFDECQKAFDKASLSILRRLSKRFAKEEDDDLEGFLGQIVLCNPRKNQTNKLHFCRVKQVEGFNLVEQNIEHIENFLNSTKKGSFNQVPSKNSWVYKLLVGIYYDGEFFNPKPAIAGGESYLSVEPILREDGAPPDVFTTSNPQNQIQSYLVKDGEFELSTMEDMLSAFIEYNTEI
jgi:hypothetical protein